MTLKVGCFFVVISLFIKKCKNWNLQEMIVVRFTFVRFTGLLKLYSKTEVLFQTSDHWLSDNFSQMIQSRMWLSCSNFFVGIRNKIQGWNKISLRKFDQFWYKTVRVTEQSMKFSIENFFSKCDRICSFLRIWSHLLRNPWW